MKKSKVHFYNLNYTDFLKKVKYDRDSFVYLADIECYDSDYDSYFEVSLMCGKSDQVYSEILPISRHLQEIKVKKRQESFSVFVAPVIHKDTIEAAEWQEKKYNIDILTLSINEFLTAIANNERVSSLLLNKSNS